MQQAVRTAAEEMLSKTVKTFTFQEIVKFGNHPYKNLPELLAQYPNKGVGFKVWRKTWPQNKFIIIKEAEFKSLRHGKIYGIEYSQGKAQSPQPIRIRNGSKRGVWRYDINGASALTQNGLSYSTEELEAFRQANSYQQKQKDSN